MTKNITDTNAWGKQQQQTNKKQANRSTSTTVTNSQFFTNFTNLFLCWIGVKARVSLINAQQPQSHWSDSPNNTTQMNNLTSNFMKHLNMDPVATFLPHIGYYVMQNTQEPSDERAGYKDWSNITLGPTQKHSRES